MLAKLSSGIIFYSASEREVLWATTGRRRHKSGICLRLKSLSYITSYNCHPTTKEMKDVTTLSNHSQVLFPAYDEVLSVIRSGSTVSKNEDGRFEIHAPTYFIEVIHNLENPKTNWNLRGSYLIFRVHHNLIIGLSNYHRKVLEFYHV